MRNTTLTQSHNGERQGKHTWNFSTSYTRVYQDIFRLNFKNVISLLLFSNALVGIHKHFTASLMKEVSNV